LFAEIQYLLAVDACEMFSCRTSSVVQMNFLPFNANVCVRERLEDLEWPAEIKNPL
jgi:hypothetical protein